jgi:hypothetical protein
MSNRISNGSIGLDSISSSFEDDVLNNFEFEVDDVLDIDIYNRFDVYYEKKLQVTPEKLQTITTAHENSNCQHKERLGIQLTKSPSLNNFIYRSSGKLDLFEPISDNKEKEANLNTRKNKMVNFRASKGGFTLQINNGAEPTI